MRLLALFATTLIAVPAWSQHRAPPARDPMPPPLLFNAEQCHSQLPRGPKRSRCIECVRQGGKFRTQGHGPGFCENAPPPPPPPAVLDSPPQCNELAHPHKRARCLECVTRGGRFFTQGPGHGYCKNAPPPPPVLPPVLVEPGQCDGLVRPPKRARCVECVTHGGRFFTQGAGHGYCKNAPPPPPPPPPEIPVLRSVPECNEHVRHPGKQARCRHCVMKGGSFHRAGPGQCVHAPPPPPPPVPEVALNVPECNTRAFPMSKRIRCRHCVVGGGRFFLPGIGRCKPGAPTPPPPEVITSIPECNHRLGPKHMRKACRRCLKKGGRFHMNGACRY